MSLFEKYFIKPSTKYLLRQSIPLLVLFIAPLFALPYTPNTPTIGKNLLVILIVFFTSILICVFHNTKKYHVYKIDLIIVTFAGYLLANFSFLSSFTVTYESALIGLCYFLCIYLFQYPNTKKGWHTVMITILIVVIIQSLISFAQHFEWIKFNSAWFTATGTFYASSQLGSYLCVGLVGSLCFLSYQYRKRKWFFSAFLVLVGLVGGALFISGSRAGALGLTSGLLTYYFSSPITLRKIKGLPFLKILLFTSLALTAMAIIGYYLYHHDTASISGRWLIFKISLDEVLKRPIWGHGVFNFDHVYNIAKADYFSTLGRAWEEIKVANHVSYPNNDILLILLETGLIGISFLVLSISIIIKKVPLAGINRIALAVLGAGITLSLFTSVLMSPATMMLCIIPTGILISVHKEKQDFIFSFHAMPIRIIMIMLCLLGSGLTLSKYHSWTNWKSFQASSLKERSMSSFIQLNGNNRNVMITHGDALLKQKNYDSAIKVLNIAHTRSPDPETTRLLAEVYRRTGRMSQYQKTLSFDVFNMPFTLESRYYLMSFYRQYGSWGKADSIARDIVALPVKIPSDEVDTYKESAQVFLSKTQSHKDSLKGFLSTYQVVSSPSLNRKILYRVYTPPIERITRRLPIIYVNDGHKFIQQGRMHKKLDSLIDNKLIKPVIAVFVDSRSPYNLDINHRKEYFLCNNAFASFFSNELSPTIEYTYPISTSVSDKAILGVSFGGLFSAYLGFIKPEQFSIISMLSPSFYPCPEIYSSYASSEKKPLRMYLTYGTGQDTHAQCVSFLDILKEQNYEVEVVIQENGNHDWSMWESQLDGFLLYYFGNK